MRRDELGKEVRGRGGRSRKEHSRLRELLGLGPVTDQSHSGHSHQEQAREDGKTPKRLC